MTPIPIPEWFERWAIEQANKGGYPNNHPISTYIAAASAAYRLLSSQGLRWVKVKDATPPMIEGKDYSENVFVICDGKLEVMAYCWINGGDEENSGYAWCNCYGNINADADLEFDDDYKPSHWMKLPTAPIQ